MFCPKCHAEYREGFEICSDCHIPLVQELSQEPSPAVPEFAMVISTGDAALIPLIKSLLENAGIEFTAKGEGLQHLFAWGHLGSSHSLVGPAEFWVRAEDEEEARELLSQLEDPVPADSEDRAGE